MAGFWIAWRVFWFAQQRPAANTPMLADLRRRQLPLTRQLAHRFWVDLQENGGLFRAEQLGKGVICHGVFGGDFTAQGSQIATPVDKSQLAMVQRIVVQAV